MSQPNPFLSSGSSIGATETGRSVDTGQGWTWIAAGFELFQKQPVTWVAVTIVLVVAWLALALIALLGPIAMLLRTIAMFLLFSIFMGGLMIGCQALARGRALEMSH